MNICYHCVGDRYLRGEIRLAGKLLKCGHCEKRRKAYSSSRIWISSSCSSFGISKDSISLINGD